ILLGCHHEQQHQELVLTDLKHAWSANPLQPVYRDVVAGPGDEPPFRWLPVEEGIAWIGRDGDGFAFDNEAPRHRVFLHRFQLATRPSPNGECLQFINDQGYDRPELWLSEGWATRQMRG